MVWTTVWLQTIGGLKCRKAICRPELMELAEIPRPLIWWGRGLLPLPKNHTSAAGPSAFDLATSSPFFSGTPNFVFPKSQLLITRWQSQLIAQTASRCSYRKARKCRIFAGMRPEFYADHPDAVPHRPADSCADASPYIGEISIFRKARPALGLFIHERS